ncbi:hypothetical protein FRACA_490037 [Frankia canadensis]|uniref:Uncharacterized protein n=1 Tax=Frankia canadensis TaxID=1836972 RepID=A0A2I2KY68_9ACTN|nr:hypothetical protein FRACA_490037 [Frankia canadensis]SOU57895.1 hypothetical protein FRACA_490037 [Frankia canadensis]
MSIDAAVHGDGAETAEPVLSLRLVDGSEVRRPLRLVRAREVVAAVPWRATRSAPVGCRRRVPPRSAWGPAGRRSSCLGPAASRIGTSMALPKM